MQIIETTNELNALLDVKRRAGMRIGLVPTMGNLHAGHYSLIRAIKAECDFVVASIFVNPTQFGVNEDFSRYPRTPKEDAAGLESQGCDLLFLPAAEEIYPLGTEAAVRVHVPKLGEILDGVSRPGHFDGVASVVTRLFARVRPDAAIFGSKDYQQLLVIRRMSSDLGFPIEIIGAPIIREANGLAMSSRNQYLDAGQREQAAEIRATLVWIADQLDETGFLQDGIASILAIETAAMQRLANAGFKPDYVAIRRTTDLGLAAGDVNESLVVLIAARLGSVRLIDNLEWSASSPA